MLNQGFIFRGNSHGIMHNYMQINLYYVIRLGEEKRIAEK